MNALLINQKDNVVVATSPIAKGANVAFVLDGRTIELVAGVDIPIYHKIAISDIATGEQIMKYGQRIGKATRDITCGEHVHCHNLASAEERK